MNKFKLLLAVIFIALGVNTVHAVTVSLNPQADAYIAQNSPATNYGTSVVLAVKASAPHSYKSYMQFNLAEIDPAKITSARLKLTATNSSGLSALWPNQTIYVYALLNASWAENTITWENAPENMADNIYNFNVPPVVLLGCFNATGTTGRYVFNNPGLLALIQGATKNSTITIMLSTNGDGCETTRFIASANNATNSNRPVLEIVADIAEVAAFSLTPQADAYIAQNATTTNYGSENVLEIKGYTPNSLKSYLQFNLSGIDLTSIYDASLKLTATTSAGVSGTWYNQTVNVYGVKNNVSWEESIITWQNAPYNSTGSAYNFVSPAVLINSFNANGMTGQYTFTDTALIELIEGSVPDGTLTFMLSMSGSGSATTRYIGSKDNSTNTNRPLLEITAPPATYVNTAESLAAAVASANPGDVIILEDNTYNNFVVTLDGDGSAGAEIIIRAETPGGVVFTGLSRIRITGQYLVFRDFKFDSIALDSDSVKDVVTLDAAIYCHITNNLFYQCGTIEDANYGVIRIKHHSRHNLINYNTFDGSTAISCLIKAHPDGSDADNNYNTVSYNYFGNIPGDPPGGNGRECIQVGQDVSDRNLQFHTTVEYNVFENVTGDGTEIVSFKTSSNIFRYNTLRNSNSGFCYRQGMDGEIYGNFFLNVRRGSRFFDYGHKIYNNYYSDDQYTTNKPLGHAIRLGANDGVNHTEANDAIVAHNTVHYSTDCYGALEFVNGVTVADGVKVYNNVFEVNDPNGGTNLRAILDTGGSTNTTYLANIVNLTGGTQLGISIDDEDMIFIGDPETSLVGEMYRPTSNSCAIDFGADISADITVDDDMDGQRRIGTIDAGADSISTHPVNRAPMTSADVGCSWE